MACTVNMYFGESVTPQAGLKVFMSSGEPVQVDNYDITPLSQALGLNFTNSGIIFSTEFLYLLKRYI